MMEGTMAVLRAEFQAEDTGARDGQE
jgi:hypothetical protein